MTTESLKNAVVFLLVILVVVTINNIVLTAKIESRVLESLRREYVPGPYEPGFDPDKVPPKSVK